MLVEMSRALSSTLAVAVLLAACDRAPTRSAPSAAPSASAAPELTSAEALRRVRALPEVTGEQHAQATAKGDGFVVTVGRGASEMTFVVDRTSGEIRVDTDAHEHFTRGHAISLAQWRDERHERPQVAARVAALPEVSGFEKGLEKAGLSLALWLEREPPKKGCTAGTLECAWAFYVGEAHPDHSVRRVSVLVDRVTGDLSVVGLDAQRMPYATWRQGRTAALMRAGK